MILMYLMTNELKLSIIMGSLLKKTNLCVKKLKQKNVYHSFIKQEGGNIYDALFKKPPTQYFTRQQ